MPLLFSGPGQRRDGVCCHWLIACEPNSPRRSVVISSASISFETQAKQVRAHRGCQVCVTTSPPEPAAPRGRPLTAGTAIS